MLEFIAEKADAIFGNVAEIEFSKKAGLIDFYNPECDIDLAYLTKKFFQAERKKSFLASFHKYS